MIILIHIFLYMNSLNPKIFLFHFTQLYIYHTFYTFILALWARNWKQKIFFESSKKFHYYWSIIPFLLGTDLLKCKCHVKVFMWAIYGTFYSQTAKASKTNHSYIKLCYYYFLFVDRLNIHIVWDKFLTLNTYWLILLYQIWV